jgi:hypothetical protein
VIGDLADAPAWCARPDSVVYPGTVSETETYQYLGFTGTATSTNNLVMTFVGSSPGGIDYTSDLSQSTWTVTYNDQVVASDCTETGQGTGTQATSPYNLPGSLIIPNQGPPTLSAAQVINVNYTGNCAGDPGTGLPILLGGWDACPYNLSKASPGRILPGGRLQFGCSRDFTIPGLPPGHGHITVTGTLSPGPATASPIVCKIEAHRPHNSGHVPGNVNATADVRCTSPIKRIVMNVELTRDNVTVGADWFRNSQQAILNGRVFVPCVNGAYAATATADLEFPPFYSPPVGTIKATSPTAQITC